MRDREAAESPSVVPKYVHNRTPSSPTVTIKPLRFLQKIQNSANSVHMTHNHCVNPLTITGISFPSILVQARH